MKTVDIFARVVDNAHQNEHLLKYGGMLIRHGAKGAVSKMNPILVWIDATKAVIQATGSYLRYCAETEITKQLRIENETLEKKLSLQLEKNDLGRQKLQKEQEIFLQKKEYQSIEYNKQSQLTQQQIRDQLALLKRMHQLLMKQRSQSGAFGELIHLQVLLDNCINSTLSLLLDITGGPNETCSSDNEKKE
ncbi:hypothetical protein [Pelistega europaea]|uniref:Uncharacterized protein n=1 Tax=Pelistega europaea TaxID=106147 RepID=A0A7Y4P618_9BURK|nr:hypothetical protein [Pelistega europaea]NOL50368.1 hypothetical protein [Pelistega europaea]